MVQLAPEDRWAIAGLAALLAIVAVDLLVEASAALIPMLGLAPLLTAVGSGPVRTAVVAVVGLIVAVPLGRVDDVFGTTEHVIEVGTVAVAGLLAIVGAGLRLQLQRRTELATDALGRERSARVRSEYLASAGQLLEAPPDPDAMLGEIARLAVPDMADVCIVDVVEDGAIDRDVIAATSPELEERVRELRRAHPVSARRAEHPVERVLRTDEPLLLPRLGSEEVGRFTDSAEQREAIEAIDYRSAAVAPLRARGRTVGVLSLLRVGPQTHPYGPDDLHVLTEIARRAALALDSARLFQEVARTEGRLEAILTNLAEAVTVQGADGRLVFANDAAAQLLGLDSAEALVAMPPEELATHFGAFDAQGRPLDLAALPGRQVLAGVEEPEPLLTRTIDRRRGEERWVTIKARPLRDGGALFAVNVIEDVTEARRAEREQRLLAVASKLVTSSLDVELTYEKAAWAAVPELADWCCVEVPDDRGRLVRRAVAAQPERLDELHAVRAALNLDPEDPENPARALIDGRARLLEPFDEQQARRLSRDPEGAEVLRHAALRSMLTVPLAVGDRILGLMTLGTDSSARRLRESDIPLAEELGRRAAIAVENARVHQARTTIAETLQRSLLPPRLPIVPGLSMAARFRAAGTDEAARVGGDFYDLFPAGDSWFVVIGDVTGKGPEAAAITSLARYTMRTAARYEPSPAGILSRLNEALAADPDRRRLCTAICMRVDAPDDEGAIPLALSCAGHPPPLRVRAGEPVEPVPAAGPLLGAFDDLEWSDTAVRLERDEALVLYTDGVTDTRGGGERFGSRRLRELCSEVPELDADALAARIDDALLSFETGPQRDDVALLVVRAGAEGFSAGAAALAGQADPKPVADL